MSEFMLSKLLISFVVYVNMKMYSTHFDNLFDQDKLFMLLMSNIHKNPEKILKSFTIVLFKFERTGEFLIHPCILDTTI
jgi:uncharacterized protein YhbP (UPF0306 family)